MKYFPFRILILCVLLPPILYVLTMQGMEYYFQDHYSKEIRNVYLGNTQSLLEGTISLKSSVARNIRRYLDSKALLSWGMKVDILVTTKSGILIYPMGFEESVFGVITDPIELAHENYQLLNDGLVIEFALKIEQLSFLSYSFLLFYLLLSIVFLTLFYRSGIHKERLLDLESKHEISRLENMEKSFQETLKDLEMEKKALVNKHEILITELYKEQKKASSNEEEMINEIVALESKISLNLSKQAEQDQEIISLKEDLSKFEKIKPKVKSSDSTVKRFSAIYKNLSFHEKAVTGYHDLPENMKIKAEEVINQLDRDSAMVPVKRKVFGKKGRETVLEVLFAYRGRLYYRRLKDGKIEIVTIGTKNDQERDLDFLDRLDKIN
ncbi:MAG: hypothetical protein KKF30_04860 [Proteobacteria bacterium]|nr:hypothetical protein [Pseudomonadota bacterium]MBU4470489.1 hypothetical protein [Pseudomonadota bacterium]MCG2753542.1 hypothetical protein [Desulfobacteraceae bacterium]